jgi:D-alanyl-D-alanine carboxypeptidase
LPPATPAAIEGGADFDVVQSGGLVPPTPPSPIPSSTPPAAPRIPEPVPLPDSAFYPVPAPSALPPSRSGDSPPPEIGALAAVLVDGASGTVLFARNAYTPLAPASLTKIATAVLVLQAGDVDREVEVDVDHRLMPRSSVMGLLPADRFTLRDLLYGLMLPSGNDAAIALARAVSGTEAAFVEEMNDLVARLNLRSTAFENPHGLGSRGHLATAYDLALLSRYAMTVPGFAELAGAPSWTASGSREIHMGNINTFLYSYPGADGVKTGYTRRAGPTIVASAVRDGRRLFAVVLNSATRDADAAALMDWGFANFSWPAAQ